ncbi:MAG: MFS transporter [Rhodospirillales bacterium]|nr:MFS transporter [Rhodospirillales bacterium]
MARDGGEGTEGLGALARAPGFLRLWAVGGLSNGMRQFEILAAGLYTFHVTHSGLAVAVVSACRNLPMFLFGALAGVVAESIDRRLILALVQTISAGASLAVAALAAAGALHPWEIALAALVSGTMWSTEGGTRRRMLGEAVAPDLVARAYAFDSLTNAFVRMVGPVSAGIAYVTLGIGGAFLLSGGCYLVALGFALGVPHRQTRRRFAPERVARDLAEGWRYARAHPAIAGSLGVTILTNLFAFSYVALVAPVAERGFGVSPGWVGVLAAGEPVGALIAGLWLARFGPPFSGRAVMAGGAALFLVAVALMPRMPNFALACLVMIPGGVGAAGFSAMQTSLIAAAAAPEIRSRVLGLLTVCIGGGPLGILAMGALGHWIGDRAAMQAMGWTGLVLVTLVAARWRRRERAAA